MLCLMLGFLWQSMELVTCAKENGIKRFGFDINTEDGSYSYTVNWWQPINYFEGEYNINIPCVAQNKELIANFECDSDVYLNGEKIINGQIISNLEPINIITCTGNIYLLNVIYGSNIPTMYIATESGDIENIYVDKNHKEQAYVTILDNNKVVYEGELDYIKGRGNSSWGGDKKPFNIKFKNKINLFSMGSAKKWCLLANYKEDTSLKHRLGYFLAEKVGFEFSPEGINMDVYINDEYIGNYILSERVEVGDNRVDITDLGKLNKLANEKQVIENSKLGGIRGKDSASVSGSMKWVEITDIPTIITGGYLLEFEMGARYDNEVSGFVSDYGQPIIIKSPEYAAKEQVEYISNYYQEFEDAVRSGDGYNSGGKHYSDYIDIPSVAKMYVFQEYIKNVDGVKTSLFFYKDAGGKIKAGPVWDCELAFGVKQIEDGINMNEPCGKWITGSHLQTNQVDKHSIFSLLCRHNDFREEAQKQWEEHFLPNIDEVLQELEIMRSVNGVSIALDKCKWSEIGISFQDSLDLFQKNVDDMKKFLVLRKEYMNELFSDKVCYLEYNSNGGHGEKIDLANYEQGTKIQVEKCVYTDEHKKFIGWNTKASGWGENITEGSTIVLKKDMTLYAQWEKMSARDYIIPFMKGIVGK